MGTSIPAVRVTTGVGVAIAAALVALALVALPGSLEAAVVTLTLQKMDISVQPVGEPFKVTLSIQKDQYDNVTVDIPSITQTFDSSKDSPNFAPYDFPTLVPTPVSYTHLTLPTNREV